MIQLILEDLNSRRPLLDHYNYLLAKVPCFIPLSDKESKQSFKEKKKKKKKGKEVKSLICYTLSVFLFILWMSEHVFFFSFVNIF